MGLCDLERRFLMLGLSGFPVIEEGKLIGIVSRSDVVRMHAVERSAEEQLSDFYRSFEDPTRAKSPAEESSEVAARVGERAAELTVRDVMIRRVISVDRDQPLSEVARMMLDGHIHRLPVLENGKLIGLVTTLDIVRLLAEGRIAEARPDTTSSDLLLPASAAKEQRLLHIRSQLERRLERLIARTSAIAKDLRSAHDQDSQERAVERENDDVLERLQASESLHIAEIREAIERIEAGCYDACEKCGNPVGEARHAALPEAVRCLPCA
jgi:CBS domain-containing protein/RNA polymerase-binding transcription factor DksA